MDNTTNTMATSSLPECTPPVGSASTFTKHPEPILDQVVAKAKREAKALKRRVKEADELWHATQHDYLALSQSTHEHIEIKPETRQDCALAFFNRETKDASAIESTTVGRSLQEVRDRVHEVKAIVRNYDKSSEESKEAVGQLSGLIDMGANSMINAETDIVRLWEAVEYMESVEGAQLLLDMGRGFW